MISTTPKRPLPPISYPIINPTQSPLSPPTTPPRTHKQGPSISNPMNWLARNTSSSSNTSQHVTAAPKPFRISEPRFDNSLEIFNLKRSGPLGSGAIVVRTPQEALSGTAVLFVAHGDGARCESALDSFSEEGMGLPALPDTPPPPPSKELSTTHIRQLHTPTNDSTSSLPLKEAHAPPCPTRPPPPPPLSLPTTLRPALKARPSTSLPDNILPVPPLPVNVSPTPPQPPFEPILLSAVPSSAIDPSKIIVTIETSSETHRTTLRSLISRPSCLSNYVTSLLPRKSVAASFYSSASDMSELPDTAFNAMFHDHLASSGFIPQSSLNIHVFLDRPSAPYAHILSYLRTPLSTPEHPAIIPRAVQLGSSSRARLEALLELRDEANYLGLEELFKLCNDQLCSRRSVVHHARGSTSSAASIHSLHTVQEDTEPGRSSSRSSNKSTRVAPPPSGTLRERSRSRENADNTPSSRQAQISTWI
ncbi:hypothetical protein K503DRAFT_764989 [Rhizopogon vinicolor AM-OR11-026]|uniref:BTB domain-containing protein n=1 Tax=Rhizopogon vinicolor AM-OR11-026 TaxID=1314800 RepID=A0A1B7NII9_9AGAM|nr:hypothetical protein K503DRAFT_764989 [Rhizopogon vinicolor AM-OR11-026]